MKRLFTSLALAFLAIGVFAQGAPELLNYQGVARDNAGNVLPNQAISLRLFIISGNSPGTVQYSESHAVTTNDFGLFNLAIGSGTTIFGAFSNIDWGSNDHYLKVDMDPAGGSSYSTLGTSQLLSVPYAMYAAESGGGLPTGTSGQTLRHNGSNWEASSNLFNDGSNIGIGTTAPTRKLEIVETNNQYLVMLARNETVNGEVAIRFEKAGQAGTGYLGYNETNNQLVIKAIPSGSSLELWGQNNSGISIDDAGNVGIGSSTPTEKLDVDNGGSIEVDGEYTYETAKTHYQSFAWNSFISSKPQTYLFGQSTVASINDRYGVFTSGGGAFGYAEAALNLPDGSTITEIKAWVWDNDNTKPVRVSLYSIALGTDDGTLSGEVESTVATAIASVQELTVATNVVVDNSTKAYNLTFTGGQMNDQTRLYGVRITYTVAKAD